MIAPSLDPSLQQQNVMGYGGTSAHLFGREGGGSPSAVQKVVVSSKRSGEKKVATHPTSCFVGVTFTNLYGKRTKTNNYIQVAKVPGFFLFYQQVIALFSFRT